MSRYLLLVLVLLACPSCQSPDLKASDRLGSALTGVERRLDEETRREASEPNSIAFRRAVGDVPVPEAAPETEEGTRTLTLDECLQSAFIQNNVIKQTREQILHVGGSKIIANSRFLPSLELISQYERLNAFDSTSDESALLGARITQRLLEFGKDNPIDVTLREEQRSALFNYESQLATVFSQVRRAFFFVKLKEEQITVRQKLLEQFERQYEIKQQRLAAGNLTVKIEVLTARLNVLNERTRINTLDRQRFNRVIELLRLVGLPVGADQVKFRDEKDKFGLGEFDTQQMTRLAWAQSSEVALQEAIVAEAQRSLSQIRYEYMPDLRFKGGYQDRNGSAGLELSNDDDTWGLDAIGQPRLPTSNDDDGRGLGLFNDEASLGYPDPGWFAGVQMRIPIADGQTRKGEQMEARADLSREKAALLDQRDLVELGVRQSFKLLVEQKFQVELARENVEIEKERFQIQEELRNAGKITDDQLETFRTGFFSAQDSLFSAQEDLIERQEDLRLAIRYFK